MLVDKKGNVWIAHENGLDKFDGKTFSLFGREQGIFTEGVNKLKIKPELLLIDGNRFKAYKKTPHQCIIKGDAKFLSIAAASILAKTYRDDFMKDAANNYPHYSWEQNMGYPTKKHREAIRQFGTTNLHRLTFQLLPKQLSLDI